MERKRGWYLTSSKARDKRDLLGQRVFLLRAPFRMWDNSGVHRDGPARA